MNKYRNEKGLTEKEFLEKYDASEYPKPSVTTDMVIFTMNEIKNEIKKSLKKLPKKELKVLLIKRKDHPFINSWALPGGFLNMNENLESCASRELKEETNVSNVYLEQLYTWGNVERDPRMRVLSVSYMALVPENKLQPKAGDDAAEIAFFTVEKNIISKSDSQICYHLIFKNKELDLSILYLIEETYVKNGYMKSMEIKVKSLSEETLAFDHAEIINMAINRLRTKVEYTPIAMNLLNKKFTMGELQMVYETILGKSLYKSNFRTKVSKMIQPLEEKEPNQVGHRPAKYYTLRKDITL